jgi:hypothetical protein
MRSAASQPHYLQPTATACFPEGSPPTWEQAIGTLELLDVESTLAYGLECPATLLLLLDPGSLYYTVTI